MRLVLGEATLTLLEEEGEPLAHWSLPALERVGRSPPRYAPGKGEAESLRIEDRGMVAAIERVRQVVKRPKRAARIRFWLGIAIFAGLGVWGWSVGLDPLYRRAAAALPPPVLERIDAALIDRLGAPCEAPEGVAALARLTQTALGEGRRALVLDGWDGAAELPSGLVVVGASALEGPDEPAVTAGWLIAGDAGAEPAHRIMRESGPRASLTLMSTGLLPEDALDAYARTLGPVPEGEALVPRFAASGISATPYARSTDDPVLAALDPHPDGGIAPLGDADWIALRTICEG